jgi:hypothetical protein
MTVANVPIGDTVGLKVLMISESGSMSFDADNLAEVVDITYFQRTTNADAVPHIFSDGERVGYVDSRRPHVADADMIIVDDPSFVAKLGKDFNLNAKVILYRINNEAYEEAGRLMKWLNPHTLGALKAAMENVDIDPEPFAFDVKVKQPGRLRRMFSRRSRA